MLLFGLTVAQLASAWLLIEEQVEAGYRASGLNAARQIAAAVKLLDELPPAQRVRAARALQGPLLRVRLGRDAAATPAVPEIREAHATMFRGMLRSLLGTDRPLTVIALATDESRPLPSPPAAGLGDHAMMMRMMMGPASGTGPSLLVDTQLADGEEVRFEYHARTDTIGLPLRLVLALAVLLISVVALSLLAVRWITRPLSLLASTAEQLGRDIHRPPLDEGGPTEVRRAARAFNTMQRRIVRHLEQRTRFLAALSHDLRTPITRLLLRNEFVRPDELREKFAADLGEMERMVTGTLDLLRGMESADPPRPIDLQALLETLQADAIETGAEVRVAGELTAPLVGNPIALKRCFDNLLGNALRYGERAWIELADRGDRIVVCIDDDGPGIPPAERERVFEPFYRIEGSRSRDTGGAGLGLAIALDVVDALRGRIELGESPHGGLRVTVELPR